MKAKKNPMQNGPQKTFQNTLGKWVERKTRTPIFVCSCGNKYIKTRGEKQSTCIRCIAKSKTLAGKR